MPCLKKGKTGARRWLLVAWLSLSSAVANAQQEYAKMQQQPRIREAIALMMDFAERTGLDGGQADRRYLWTDAFGVDTGARCTATCISLARRRRAST